jgi:hypothetical protein
MAGSIAVTMTDLGGRGTKYSIAWTSDASGNVNNNSFKNGRLHHLDLNGFVKSWPALAITVLYPAGYALTDSTLADAVDAVIRMVKGRYFAQSRDPALRAENIEGVWSAQYWFAAGPGAAVGNLPPDIEALLEKYRVPAFG